MSEHHDENAEHKPHKSHKSGGHGGGGGHDEAHEGAPEWLISFADNVTLMMGFFVVLLAINMSQAMATGGGKKSDPEGMPYETPVGMLDAAIAIREAFNNPVSPLSNNPAELSLVKRVLERAQEGYAMNAGVKGNKHDVQATRPGDYRKPVALIEFESSSAELSKASIESIQSAANLYRGVRLILEVRGHASAEEAFKQSDHGMRLSFDRASAVAKALTDNGLDWRQVFIVACGDNDRLKDIAYDREGQRVNSCVEIVPTDKAIRPGATDDAEPVAEKPMTAPKTPQPIH